MQAYCHCTGGFPPKRQANSAMWKSYWSQYFCASAKASANCSPDRTSELSGIPSASHRSTSVMSSIGNGHNQYLPVN